MAPTRSIQGYSASTLKCNTHYSTTFLISLPIVCALVCWRSGFVSLAAAQYRDRDPSDKSATHSVPLAARWWQAPPSRGLGRVTRAAWKRRDSSTRWGRRVGPRARPMSSSRLGSKGEPARAQAQAASGRHHLPPPRHHLRGLRRAAALNRRPRRPRAAPGFGRRRSRFRPAARRCARRVVGRLGESPPAWLRIARRDALV